MMAKEAFGSRKLHKIQFHPNLELYSNLPRKIGGIKQVKNKKGSNFGPVLSSNADGKPQVPLCIMLGWFAAKKRHLMKFVDLYLDQEFDVLLFTPPLSVLAHPTLSFKYWGKFLLKFYANAKDSYTSIFVHGFSIGAMVWGTFLRHIKDQVGEYETLAGKVRGQLWDSPFIDAERIPEVGSSVVSSGNHVVRSMLKLYATAVTNGRESRKCSEAFENSNFNGPYLVMCSEDDSIALSPRVAACAQIWRENGSIVYWKSWESCPHVGLMKQNPKEYQELWLQFLEKTGLLSSNSGQQKPCWLYPIQRLS